MKAVIYHDLTLLINVIHFLLKNNCVSQQSFLQIYCFVYKVNKSYVRYFLLGLKLFYFRTFSF